MAAAGGKEEVLPWMQRPSSHRQSWPTKQEYAKELKAQMAEKCARDAVGGRGSNYKRIGPSKYQYCTPCLCVHYRSVQVLYTVFVRLEGVCITCLLTRIHMYKSAA